MRYTPCPFQGWLSKQARAEVAAVAGRQPRGVLFSQLVPEFRDKVHIRFKEKADIEAVLRAQDPLSQDFHFQDALLPAGSRLLCRRIPPALCIGGESWGVPPILEAEFEVHHTPADFMARPKKLVHPFDAADLVTDVAFRAIFATLTRSAQETRAMRQRTLSKRASLGERASAGGGRVARKDA